MLTVTESKELCKKYGLDPSKKYGQNFLIVIGPITKMVQAARISKKDTVVEIGPGFGVLTFELANKSNKVIAFEIERKLVDYWQDKCKDYDNVKIVWGNFLKESDKYLNELGKYVVVANLPYQITGQVFRTLFETKNKPKRVVVMVQKEVAQRVVAKVPNMNLLATSIQYYGNPKIVTKVSAGSFYPKPKVDSAVLLIDNIKDKKNSDKFFKIVKAAYANPRKQVWKNISTGFNIDAQLVKKVLVEVVGSEKVRAQEIGVGQWEKVIDMFM